MGKAAEEGRNTTEDMDTKPGQCSSSENGSGGESSMQVQPPVHLYVIMADTIIELLNEKTNVSKV